MDPFLSSGSRVAIVGGGPAGSFAALHLLDQARRAGLQLAVTIFEPRPFSLPGPAGCNRCAGILSSRLISGLEALGIELPAELIQADVQSYAVHLRGQTLTVERPGPQHRILSVYRGAGPRLLQGAPQPSFDAYLLEQAQGRGAAVVAERVKQVTSGDDRPVVHTASAHLVVDFLVLAIGVNSRSPLDPAFGYTPPPTETMAQNEVLRPPDWPQDQVKVYFTQQAGVMFGALIPKGEYLNVSLLGEELRLENVRTFLDSQRLAGTVPASPEDGSGQGLTDSPAGQTGGLCGCTPRIAVQPARRLFGNRWVAVGDAAAARLYKDGIGSAFYSAQRAMTTAVTRGVSVAAFTAEYAPFCRAIGRDNRFGRGLFRMWALTLARPELLGAWMQAVRRESASPPGSRIHQRVLWGMFTGAESYRTLFWLATSPRATAEVVAAWSQVKRGAAIGS